MAEWPIPDETVDALSVEVRQSRADWAGRVVQLRIGNGSELDLTVTGARLESGFAAVGTMLVRTGATPRPRPVPAGREREISLALGSPTCPAVDRAVAAEIDLIDAEGRTATWRGALGDPQRHLARIHGEDCAELFVATGATLSFDQRLDTREDGGAVIGSVTLRAEPISGGPRVEVLEVEDTVLFGAAGGQDGWAVAIDTAAGASEVRLDLVPARCDPHAVADDKRGTYFAIHARVDGVDRPAFYLHAGDGLAGELKRFVGVACRWGSD